MDTLVLLLLWGWWSDSYFRHAIFQSSQVNSKSTRKLVGFLQDREHLSPGSVLEASFSNDSCASSSPDDVSGKDSFIKLFII